MAGKPPRTAAKLIECRSREEWLAERRKRIQASEMAYVCEVSDYGSKLSLYYDKVDPAAFSEATQRQRIGLKMEGVILDELEAEYGGKAHQWPQYTIAEHPEISYLGCTPDALYECPDRPGLGNCQIKTASEYQRREWFEDLPLAYLVQVQTEMFCLGLNWSVLAVAFGCQSVERFFIDRDDRFLAAMMKVAGEFWGMVCDRVEPPACESKATAKALARIHPNDNGLAVELPPDAYEVIESLERAKKIKKLADRRIDRCENQIKAWLGDNTYGVHGDKVYSWKTQDRKEYVVPAGTSRVFRGHSKLPRGIEVIGPAAVDYRTTDRVKLPKWVKSQLLSQSTACRWCGATLTSRTATIEHVVPLAKGGTNAITNLSLACKACNEKRGDDATLPVSLAKV